MGERWLLLNNSRSTHPSRDGSLVQDSDFFGFRFGSLLPGDHTREEISALRLRENETLPPITLCSIWQHLPPTCRSIYQGNCLYTLLRRPWSRGRARHLAPQQFRLISVFVSALLAKNIITRVPKDRSFVSFPFLVPKASGKHRLIIDYRHLREKDLYTAPRFRLIPIIASERAAPSLKSAVFFAKIDLRDAFYSMPILPALRRVSTFKLGRQYYQFKRLPMGLFISPYLLQSTLRTLLLGLDQTWVHLDDILLWDQSAVQLHKRVAELLRRLHSVGFRINVVKSQLAPQRKITFCGLALSCGNWDFTRDKLSSLRKILSDWPKRAFTHKWFQTRGFLAYMLTSIGLSSAWLRLCDRQFWRRLLASVFFTLPRAWRDKPPCLVNWAVDAAAMDFAIIDQKGTLQLHGRHLAHINLGEVWALTLAAVLAPKGAVIWTDSQVAAAWRYRARAALVISALLSVIAVQKSLHFAWLPSKWNPADQFTRATSQDHVWSMSDIVRTALGCVSIQHGNDVRAC